MRRRALVNVLQIVIAFVLAMVVCFLLSSCRTEYIPIEVVRIDTLHHTAYRVDSIQSVDSVYIKEVVKGDTVVIEKTKIKYRDRVKEVTDTIKETVVQTIEKPIEVEKKLTAWQKFKINAGEWLLGGVVALLVAFAFFWVINWRRR